jgi:dephospho-CoA kinase
MSWAPDLLISVASGVSVAAIVAVSRALWVRRRVPIALSQSVIRKHYVEQILSLSTQDTVTSLDALSPRFAPRGHDSQIASLQDAWAAINRRGRVRVVIGSTDSAITGGAEMVGKGVEVRVSPSFSSQNLSYHIFNGDQVASTVVNHQVDDRVQPALLDGIGPLDVFRHHFATTWDMSTPLESVIAEQAIRRAGPDADANAVGQALRDRSLLYRLDDNVRAAVAQHAAFRHSSSIIFIVGLPGSGKSFTRRELAGRLGSLRIQTQELTDYVFAYRDFLHGSIRLAPPRGQGFEPEQAGAFKVSEETHLRPALSSLASRVLSGVGSQEVTLVEFARSDILAALQEFGEESIMRSQIVYVQAPASLREERLRRRARPPELAVSGAVTITVTVSDDHRLPSAAQKSIYGLDDITVLRSDLRWRDRVFTIVNDKDHSPQFDAALNDLITRVTSPYVTIRR